MDFGYKWELTSDWELVVLTWTRTNRRIIIGDPYNQDMIFSRSCPCQPRNGWIVDSYGSRFGWQGFVKWIRNEKVRQGATRIHHLTVSKLILASSILLSYFISIVYLIWFLYISKEQGEELELLVEEGSTTSPSPEIKEQGLIENELRLSRI